MSKTAPLRLAALVVIFVAAAASVPGCVEAPGNGGIEDFQLDVGYGPQGGDATADEDAGADAAQQGDAAGLPTYVTKTVIPAGRYASLQRLSTMMTLPPAGTPVESVNTSISVHEVTHSAEGVSVTSTTCGMWQPEITGVQTVFSEAFVAAIPAWTSNITVSTNSDGAPRFRLATQPLIFGADLPDPATSPLPTKGDDPSVVDVDKDGNPGVTVKLVGIITGQIYVVQRRSSGLDGVVELATGRIEGHLLGEVEQQVVGASEPELMLLDLSPTKHPDPDRSVFTWLPLAASETCESLMAAGEARFE